MQLSAFCQKRALANSAPRVAAVESLLWLHRHGINRCWRGFFEHWNVFQHWPVLLFRSTEIVQRCSSVVFTSRVGRITSHRFSETPRWFETKDISRSSEPITKRSLRVKITSFDASLASFYHYQPQRCNSFIRCFDILCVFFVLNFISWVLDVDIKFFCLLAS